MDKLIKKSHYKKALVSQPFFIFNSLKNEQDITELDDEDFIDLVWDMEDIVSETDSPSEKIVKTFRIIDEWLMSYLLKRYDCEIIKGSVEEKLKKTKDIMNSKKLLISPVFEQNGAISTPFAFDTESKQIINIKYSMKTKLQDILDMQYDWEIISAQTQVKDCYLFVPKNKTYRKGEIDLEPINYAHISKAGKYPNETSAKGESDEISFIDAFTKGLPQKGQSSVLLPNFENVIAKIIRSVDVKEPSLDFEQDITPYGKNKEWALLLEHMNSYFAGYNGKVFKPTKFDFTSSEKPPLSAIGTEKNVVWDELWRIQDTKQSYIDKSLLTPYEEIKNSSLVVWYDFEGFSLPFAPMDRVKPYNQVVFQVSTIVTKDNVEIEKENLVIDPLNISSDDFVKISRAIYREGAEKYVVYNKSYELTRLKEMLNILIATEHKDLAEFTMHYDAIKDNTVDLCDLFVINSPNKLPAIMLYDQKARYSIKNVEKHITKNGIKVPRPIYPYKELEVPNGGAAMELAINRALDIIGEKEWAEKVVHLKQYCENDVRAMIMVFDYVEMLIEKSQNA